ncbi:DegV family protein [Haliovirga abyssi]|uniref:DhaL domain-containing protein n=1 Tax=Haliovirga abyssi TaxID=2996794 RepID=A0AAU9DIK4_9FUSO|nr:DegV family protein [Haliovirga abyssi]BDU49617.1 hypothetical protein HLVA_01860 [Haliovirga abyssi]
MGIKYINAIRLKKMLIAGSRWLVKHQDILNELNIYPVPDGDTGTNMSMTVKSIEEELNKFNEKQDMDSLINVVSETVLLGARGNSGTILSQIIHGFLKPLEGKEKIYAKDIAVSLDSAQKTAYEAVQEPVEGTILTVVRIVSEKANEFVKTNNDLIELLEYIKRIAEKEVENTKNLLPKLKEADVVDAGAKGFFYILEGFEKLIKDGIIIEEIEENITTKELSGIFNLSNSEEELKYKYCTEFIINGSDFDFEEFKDKLSELGDSMVAVQVANKTKAHIHTNNPGLAIEFALKHGELIMIKIDNMGVQHKSVVIKDKVEKIMINKIQNKEDGYIAVADTIEIANLFLKLGANAVIVGGQSNNPSVADISEAISKIDAKRIVLLPNNKNIISTANLASQRAGKNSLVMDTKSIVEGYFILRNKIENIEDLLNALKRNYSIEVTQAVKDTKINDLAIKKGDYIALVNNKIEIAEKKLEDIIEKISEKYIDNKTIQVSIFKGENVTQKSETKIKDKFKNIKTECFTGNQKNYFYYMYIENRDEELPEIAIVTDSTSDLEQEMINGLPVYIVPLKVNLDGEYKKEKEEITKGQFWKSLLEMDGLPKTSQPSPAEFKNLYKKLLEKGYKKIISIHISGKLSGTHQAARVARNMIGKNENDIKIIDSKTVMSSLGHLVIEAGKKAVEKENFEQIIEWVEKTKDKGLLIGSVSSLKYLEKGGRIGKAASLIGGILKMHPIVKIEDGEVYSAKKVIGDLGVYNYFEKILKEEMKKGPIIVYNLWGGTATELANAKKLFKLEEKYDKITVRGVVETGSVVGSHVGPIYGLVIYPKLN